MGFADDEVRELLELWPNAQRFEEGTKSFFLLPALQLPDGCTPAALDALLCAHERDGYPSRLYFEREAQSNKKPNWNTRNVSIIGRSWDAFSWKVDPATTRLSLIVRSFLRALE